jgi:hypothetical protein
MTEHSVHGLPRCSSRYSRDSTYLAAAALGAMLDDHGPASAGDEHGRMERLSVTQ